MAHHYGFGTGRAPSPQCWSTHSCSTASDNGPERHAGCRRKMARSPGFALQTRSTVFFQRYLNFDSSFDSRPTGFRMGQTIAILFIDHSTIARLFRKTDNPELSAASGIDLESAKGMIRSSASITGTFPTTLEPHPESNANREFLRNRVCSQVSKPNVKSPARQWRSPNKKRHSSRHNDSPIWSQSAGSNLDQISITATRQSPCKSMSSIRAQ